MISRKELEARILPRPRKLILTDGAPLTVTPGTVFSLTVPEDAGAAEEKLRKHLAVGEKGLPVTLSYGTAPEGMENSDEGYALALDDSGIRITGFGKTGLFYGVLTLCQLLGREGKGLRLPALEILDWPQKKMRGLFVETRYGTNVMEKADWLQMLDDAAEKKLNVMHLGIYGCWTVQYDGRVSEYLYVPIPKYPQLQTPMVVKYYSPAEDKWISCEQLPPIFREDFFGELIRYGRERGITVYPTWNSLGHNTLLPGKFPEISARDENGEPALVGFCTSNEKTYEILFDIYDHIIDRYLLPNGITTFCIGMDEVMDGVGSNAGDIFKRRSPWCKCEKCRSRGKSDIFVDHIIRQTKHLKEKGMKTVAIYGDELRSKHEVRTTVGCGEQLMQALEKEGLKENMLVTWWSYTDIRAKLDFEDLRPDLGLRSVVVPYTGYYHWEAMTHPLKNIWYLAQIGHKDNAEGMEAYSSWDRSYDRNYDAVAEYSWDYENAGTPREVTERYVLRNFPGREEETLRALRMMELITEVRVKNLEDPDSTVLSNSYVMRQMLNYYLYSYVQSNRPYPRNFPGEALEEMLKHRDAYERVLLENAAMARQATDIFTQVADDEHCNRDIARRFAYECRNYLCIAEDWLAILRMQELCNAAEYGKMAKIAACRRDERLKLMAHCEQVKEDYICKGLTMRNHSIFMQMFTDIASYIESADVPCLDMLDISPIMSSRFWELR